MDIKSQIKDSAKRFYLLNKVSDDTLIGGEKWKDIREQVCKGDSYKTETWYTDLMDHQQRLLDDLKQM